MQKSRESVLPPVDLFTTRTLSPGHGYIFLGFTSPLGRSSIVMVRLLEQGAHTPLSVSEVPSGYGALRSAHAASATMTPSTRPLNTARSTTDRRSAPGIL